jgi:hypothetical protein
MDRAGDIGNGTKKDLGSREHPNMTTRSGRPGLSGEPWSTAQNILRSEKVLWSGRNVENPAQESTILRFRAGWQLKRRRLGMGRHAVACGFILIASRKVEKSLVILDPWHLPQD